jgi:hypothetical protein
MMTDDKLIEAACKIEDCRVADLLYSRVREDGRVVLIIGPAGRKRVVDIAAGDISADDMSEEPPVTTADVGPGPVFAELVPKRLLVILAKHGLDNPEVLREMSNSELEALPGIGRAAVKQIRGVLDQLG